MERNYPKSFETFWNKLERNGKTKKSKNGFIYEFEVVGKGDNCNIEISLDGEYVACVPNDMERLYCECLGNYLFSRVKEY